jgi:hypothetical protein
VPFPEGGELGDDAVPVHLRLAAYAPDESLVVTPRLGELVPQRRRAQQVAHPHAPAADLVFVGGAGAPQGRPEGALPALLFREGLQGVVVGQDEVNPVRDHQVLADLDPEVLELLLLALEGGGVDDHAVAGDAEDARVEYPRRDHVENELLSPDDDRVTGVVPPVVAGHHLHPGGEQVHDLAFAFVAPLGADDHDVGHVGAVEAELFEGGLRRHARGRNQRLGLKGVAALLPELAEVRSVEREEAALGESHRVDATGVLTLGVGAQERAAEQDLAARPAAVAVAPPLRDQRVGVFAQHVALHEAPDLPAHLQGRQGPVGHPHLSFPPVKG